jgi:hypothetical protein
MRVWKSGLERLKAVQKVFWTQQGKEGGMQAANAR